MPNDELVVKPPGDAATVEQLQLYARELHQLYEQERRTREEMQEQWDVLEKKVRELTALNSLFQTYLKEREDIKEALLTLMGNVRGLASLLSEIEASLQAKGYLPAKDEASNG